MATCCIQYTLDPRKVDSFEAYAARWPPIIERCGGTLVGYYLPKEGANNFVIRSDLIRNTDTNLEGNESAGSCTPAAVSQPVAHEDRGGSPWRIKVKRDRPRRSDPDVDGWRKRQPRADEFQPSVLLKGTEVAGYSNRP